MGKDRSGTNNSMKTTAKNNKKQLKLKAEVIEAEVIEAEVIVAEGTVCSRTYDALKITIEFATQARWIMIFIKSNLTKFFAWMLSINIWIDIFCIYQL